MPNAKDKVTLRTCAINVFGGIICVHKSVNNSCCYSIRDWFISSFSERDGNRTVNFVFVVYFSVSVDEVYSVFFVVVGRVVVFLVVASIIVFIRLSFLNAVAESFLFTLFPGYFLP